jgi:hypothetical protein
MRGLIMALWISSTAHLAAQITSQPVPDANPGRPTVSTPATLTPIGYLQFENGVHNAWRSPEFSIRLAVNQVTKLTVLPRVELLVASEPAIHSNGGMDTKTRPGEVFAGVQGVVLSGHGLRPTIAVSYVRRLYASPAPELDVGTFRQSGIFLVSNDVLGFHIDANGIISEQAEATARRAQWGQTLSISRPWKRLTISGEIWHFSQPFLNSNAVGNLWAASYAVRGNLIIDGGFNRGLTHSSTQWEAFAGFTYLLPRRLWSQRGAP